MSGKFGRGIKIISKALFCCWLLVVGCWFFDLGGFASSFGRFFASPLTRAMYFWSLFSLIFFSESLFASLFSSFEIMVAFFFCR